MPSSTDAELPFSVPDYLPNYYPMQGPHSDPYGIDPFGEMYGNNYDPYGGATAYGSPGNPGPIVQTYPPGYDPNAYGVEPGPERGGGGYNYSDTVGSGGPPPFTDPSVFWPQVTETDTTPEPWYGRLLRMSGIGYGAPQLAHTLLQARRDWLATHPHDQAGTVNGHLITPNDLTPRQQWEQQWAPQLADARRMAAEQGRIRLIVGSSPVGSRLAGGHTGDAGHTQNYFYPANPRERIDSIRAMYPNGISTGTDPNTGATVHSTPIGRDAVPRSNGVPQFTPPLPPEIYQQIYG